MNAGRLNRNRCLQSFMQNAPKTCYEYSRARMQPEKQARVQHSLVHESATAQWVTTGRNT